MIVETLYKKIVARIKAELVEFENKTYVLPAPDAAPEPYITPYVGVIYRGSTIIPEKGTGSIKKHLFDVLVYLEVWKDDETLILGKGKRKGLLEYVEDLRGVLEEYRFFTEIGSNIINVDIMQIIGFNAFWVSASKYSAYSGLTIQYTEGS